MSFRCPYCDQPTTLTSPNTDSRWQRINIGDELLAEGSDIGINYYAVACPNEDCKKLFLKVGLTKAVDVHGYWRSGQNLEEWQLLPESAAKPQPDYIPQQIVQDYQEACRIKNLSPKASATLARRALQGMIRDFWGIKKDKLKLEIDALEQEVPTSTWEAIDAVRSVGNIGAHMEKDVNVIVDIEPDEADLLINLLEDLFEEWYVARYQREQRQQRIKDLAQKKKAERKPKKT